MEVKSGEEQTVWRYGDEEAWRKKRRQCGKEAVGRDRGKRGGGEGCGRIGGREVEGKAAWRYGGEEAWRKKGRQCGGEAVGVEEEEEVVSMVEELMVGRRGGSMEMWW